MLDIKICNITKDDLTLIIVDVHHVADYDLYVSNHFISFCVLLENSQHNKRRNRLIVSANVETNNRTNKRNKTKEINLCNLNRYRTS